MAEFLRANLNGRLSARTWAAAITTPWPVEAPNHGFLLAAGDRIVGVQTAVYSERLIMGRPWRICNLAARCVTDDYRIHGARLLRSALAQPGYTFTDLSLNGAGPGRDQRLSFTEFDTRSVLLPNVPRFGGRSIDVTDDPEAMAGTLTGDDLQRYQDHRGCLAARQVMISTGAEHCHVIYRRDRRRGMAAFASILHASAPELLQRTLPELRSYLIRHDGLVATMAEIRLIGRPAGAVDLSVRRRKAFCSDQLTADQLDYLYSELTCLPC